MKGNNRPCECCGNNDIDLYVVSSGVSAMSNNICLVCISMNVEITQFGNNNTYNTNDDMYYDSSDNHIPIKLISGITFNTRNEYVHYMKKLNAD